MSPTARHLLPTVNQRPKRPYACSRIRQGLTAIALLLTAVLLLAWLKLLSAHLHQPAVPARSAFKVNYVVRDAPLDALTAGRGVTFQLLLESACGEPGDGTAILAAPVVTTPSVVTRVFMTDRMKDLSSPEQTFKQPAVCHVSEALLLNKDAFEMRCTSPSHVLAMSSTPQFYADSRGLVSVIYAAWAQELPLTLRPDDVWMHLIQQVAWHITKRAEHYKPLFGEGLEDQGDISLEYDSRPPWTEIIVDLAARVHSKVHPTKGEQLLAKFSTTTTTDALVQEVLTLDSMKPNFDYGVNTTCGIPAVNLLGSENDWRLLVQKWEELITFFKRNGKFASQPWFAKWTETAVRPFLANLLATYLEDSPNVHKFWQGIVKHQDMDEDAACYAEHKSYINGWLLSLALYDKESRPIDHAWLFNTKDDGLEYSEFPSVVAALPFSLSGNPSHLFAGCFGFAGLPDGSLGAVQAWAVTQGATCDNTG
jgi:hypothetical protein